MQQARCDGSTRRTAGSRRPRAPRPYLVVGKRLELLVQIADAVLCRHAHVCIIALAAIMGALEPVAAEVLQAEAVD